MKLHSKAKKIGNEFRSSRRHRPRDASSPMAAATPATNLVGRAARPTHNRYPPGRVLWPGWRWNRLRWQRPTIRC